MADEFDYGPQRRGIFQNIRVYCACAPILWSRALQADPCHRARFYRLLGHRPLRLRYVRHLHRCLSPLCRLMCACVPLQRYRWRCRSTALLPGALWLCWEYPESQRHLLKCCLRPAGGCFLRFAGERSRKFLYRTAVDTFHVHHHFFDWRGKLLENRSMHIIAQRLRLDPANHCWRVPRPGIHLRRSRRRGSWHRRHLRRRAGVCVRVFPQGGPGTYHRSLPDHGRHWCHAELLDQS